jgi:PAS domain S-box-containing protein
MSNNEHLTAISVSQATRTIHVYGVILLDLEGTVQSWNQGASELLGFTAEEAIGQHFEFIFTPEDVSLQAPQAEMEKARSETYAYDDRWHMRRDRTRIYVNGGLCLLKNEKGEGLGFIKILRDQTDKRERIEHIENLNAKLREAHESLHDYAACLEDRVAERTHQLNERNKELEAFCYSIAHDLRGPLRSIQAMSQVTLEDYGPAMDDTCRDYLHRIAQAGLRLDRLTLDLLKYSRLAREEIELETLSVETAIDEVLASLHQTIVTSRAEIRIERPLPEVHAQHAYLVQIFLNLISNALKFVGDGVHPIIEIRAEADGDRVRIFVRDNGIGIPDEYRDKIFQLFERLHPDGTFEGTGVGLAIARKAAARINGRIGLAPAAASGATFWVDLEHARPGV